METWQAFLLGVMAACTPGLVIFAVMLYFAPAGTER